MLLFSNYIVLIFLSFLSYTHPVQNTHDLEVSIKNLKNNDGQVLVGLYSSESSFLDKTFMGEVAVIKNNECRVVFKNVPEGVYAVSYVHDENNNGKMDSNFMGIPKEDYGCSNNATGFMGPPKWKDAKFEFNSTKSILIN